MKFFYLVQSVAAIAFFYFSSGLLFWDASASSYKYTDSLFSSGSDDDISLFLYGVVCLLGFLLLLFRKSSINYVFIIFILISILQFFSLLLIQVGSIWLTIFYEGNFFLIITFLMEIAVIVTCLYTKLKKH